MSINLRQANEMQQQGFIEGYTAVMKGQWALKFTDCGDEGWLCELPSIKGMVERGDSKEQAFNELIISLRVKLMYDNKLPTPPTE